METLRKIQFCQLDILKTVTEICERHNIQYYLAYGTLLGAVRHKGFIPWDDDVDICMHYEDLKRFKKICKKELPEKYFYQDSYTDPGARWLYAKIRANGTSMSETYPTNGVHANYHEGVWIDIFPLLEAADLPDKLDQQVSNIFEYQRTLFYLTPNKKDMGICDKMIASVRDIKVKAALARYRKNFERLRSASSDFMIVMANSYFTDNTADNRKKALKVSISKELLVPTKYSFEGTAFWGIKDYDTFLSKVYGNDYMTPKQWAHLPDYSHVIV